MENKQQEAEEARERVRKLEEVNEEIETCDRSIKT